MAACSESVGWQFKNHGTLLTGLVQFKLASSSIFTVIGCFLFVKPPDMCTFPYTKLTGRNAANSDFPMAATDGPTLVEKTPLPRIVTTPPPRIGYGLG